MEKNNNDFKTEITKVFNKVELENIRLGMEIASITQEYYYPKLIAFLKGDTTDCGSMYFEKLKPLYDKYGYERVNRILIALEEAKEQTNE